MGLRLNRQRDGSLRPYFEGEFRDRNKRRRIVNLGKWEGTAPLSGSLRDKGDYQFELSRQRAQVALNRMQEEARDDSRSDRQMEALIRAKTGTKIEYVRIDELQKHWRNIIRDPAPTEEHMRNYDALFRRFQIFMAERKPSAQYIYDVTPDDVRAFIKLTREQLAASTAQRLRNLLTRAFKRFLPSGIANPFAGFITRRRPTEIAVIHRRPFTEGELEKILETAKSDEFMYPLIVTAMCTGMRRGDVCRLRWACIDLEDKMMAVKTNKSGETVDIPIFPRLQHVLNKMPVTDEFVFRDAFAMHENNSDGLSCRMKRILTRALAPRNTEPLPEVASGSSILKIGERVITKQVKKVGRRERILTIFRQYCGGMSMPSIAKQSGLSKGTISYDLNLVQKWIGIPFVRSSQTEGLKPSIDKYTRTKRQIGQKSASIRDWHAFRTTWVTLALKAGIPIELVQRVTGHKTVQLVLESYFHPDREHFRHALTNAMPSVLTGVPKEVSATNPVDDLADLAAKLKIGKATDEEKVRFKQLAASL